VCARALGRGCCSQRGLMFIAEFYSWWSVIFCLYGQSLILVGLYGSKIIAEDKGFSLMDNNYY
jgi:hypothetical protein